MGCILENYNNDFDFLSDNYRDSNEWEYTYGERQEATKGYYISTL